MDNQQSYIVFSNNYYIDLRDGRIHNNEGETVHKLSPRLYNLLRLLAKNADSYTSIEELWKLISPEQTDPKKANANIRKRISDLRRVIEDNCHFAPTEGLLNIQNIIPLNTVQKVQGYGFFTSDYVLIKHTPFFLSPDDKNSDEEKSEKMAAERKIIDNLADRASTESKKGNDREALKIRKEVYQWRLKNLGEYDEDTIKAMANLATSYNKLKMYDEALLLRRKVHDYRVKHCDPASDLLRKAKRNLATTLNSIGGEENIREAELLRNEISEILEQQQTE